MLSLFPELLAYEQVSPFLIRLTLGTIMIYWSFIGMRDNTGPKRVLDTIQGLLGVLLIVGLWTQAAALLAALGFLICLIQKIRDRAFMTNGVNYVWILFIMALSLLFTGPGIWSFDVPL